MTETLRGVSPSKTDLLEEPSLAEAAVAGVSSAPGPVIATPRARAERTSFPRDRQLLLRGLCQVDDIGRRIGLTA